MLFAKKPFRRTFPFAAFFVVLLLCLSNAPALFADDIDDAKDLFQKGDYAGCIKAAKKGLDNDPGEEEWPLLLSRAQRATGLYPEAMTTIVGGLARFPTSIQIHLEGYYVFNANGRTERAKTMLQNISDIVTSLSTGRRGSRVRAGSLTPAGMVALGNALLLMNVEPKLILENFFNQVTNVVPDYREAYIAAGNLALEKNDFDLAAKTFRQTLQKFPDDPDAQFGLARAFAPSDAEQMGHYLEAVLNLNPNHVPAMLLLVDHLIDAEQYDDAGKLLDNIAKVNPWDPEAWSYRAVIAHLQSDTNAETRARTSALKYWSTNPRVDELIGTKLSQNYRFLEGSQHEQQALEFDPDYLPAKAQLAQDLLRLGDEDEGWRLAREVHDQDGYDVTAYNLVTLQKTMAKYSTITNHDFVVRMATNEAAIYGDQVLELLQRAKDTVTKKYGFQLDQPTYVEIFAAQKDFGVRTFGMPHNPGFLGVCFGHVITANSPAAQSGQPENWQAVLWHEFCHVVTLGITRNKMPRWLSEGISVYEESQQNPVWGQRMNPTYREMILGGELTPISDLSSAFMTPKSPMHVQFAYYESSLVVEYIVQKFGLNSLKQILTDLGNGVNINDAIARHTVSMAKLEKDFAAFAHDRALNLAPGLDWKKPADETTPAPNRPTIDLTGTNALNLEVIKKLLTRLDAQTNATAANPTEASTNGTNASGTNAAFATHKAPLPNFYDLLGQARDALENHEWEQARAPLKKLVDLYPGQTGSDSAYPLLAAVYRQMNDTNLERDVLVKMTSMEADSTDAYLRLMEVDDGRKDWAGVYENANRFLAVNPLVPQPYRLLARSSEQLGRNDPAIRSYQRLLLLDPPDPADVHYRLAVLLKKNGDTAGAKRHVLQALEEAPRFPAALHLLLEIEGPTEAKIAAPPAAKK